jgi:RimJ/RimL family protein N-acetyltransferase
LATARDSLQSTQLADGRAVQVSHAQTTDAADILRYLDLVSGETDFLTFGSGEFSMTEQDEAQYIDRLYKTATGVMLKATVGGEIVSVTGLQRIQRPRIRHVATLGISVVKQFWGTGLARIMCERAFSEAADLGVRRVELKVREDNHRALRLYRTLGFLEEGRLRRSFVVDDRVFDELTMALLLDESSPPRVQAP